jgi:hypothetical protein
MEAAPLAEVMTQYLLKEAAELIGREELATRMKVPLSMLDAWREGHAAMPVGRLVLLAAILEELAK